MRSLALFLFSLAGSGTAAPHGQTVGQQLIQGVSTDAVPGESKDSAAPLPGFNHLARNRTQAVIESPDRAAFEGACVQVTLGGHGKVGMTTLEGRCVDGAGLWFETSINLNDCIGNAGGSLSYRESPCTLDDVHDGDKMLLKCNCLDDTRFPRYTALEMGSGVSNLLAVRPVDGRFICGSRVGIKSPAFATGRSVA